MARILAITSGRSDWPEPKDSQLGLTVLFSVPVVARGRLKHQKSNICYHKIASAGDTAPCAAVGPAVAAFKTAASWSAAEAP